ncbi:MAG: hypothetical protein WA903_09105 [Ornithinimicrobium sp.]
MPVSHVIGDTVGPDELNASYIVPSVFDPHAAAAVRKVAETARLRSGEAARRP